MAVPSRFILHQGPVLRALSGAAVAAVRQRLGQAPTAPPALPGPEIRAVIPPRPPALVRAYVRNVGGEPSAYRRTLPSHLFPQWGFGLAARTLTGIPYPMLRVMNGGCRLEIRSPLPADEPLHVTARLEDIDDDGRRAVLHQRVVTASSSDTEALVAHLYAIVPVAAAKRDGKRKERPRVPQDVREVGFWRINARAGLDFAKLTGDFNPVHWVPAYARSMGFANVILHGFATMARAMEGLHRALFVGDVAAIATFDCKFTRPLVLPAKVGLYVGDHNDVYVGDAPGGPAYLVGTFSTQGARP